MSKYGYLYRLVGAIAISSAILSLTLGTVMRFPQGIRFAASHENGRSAKPLNLLAVSRPADPFREAIGQATRAATLAQSAFSPTDWNQVAMAWIEAVAWMQTVPPNSPKRVFAEKKVAEYLQNFTFAQRRAAGNFGLSYPTFNSEILDRQLELYLSYIAAVGIPDVAIIGSSRALQGIDPSVLQQALAAQGYPGLRIFNFGVNGATAQVVNFMLSQLLTSNQLPRMIVWADGLRAFNNGRVDRTYNEILNSPGYRLLRSGTRPTLGSQLPATAISEGTFQNQQLYSYHPVANYATSPPRVDPLVGAMPQSGSLTGMVPGILAQGLQGSSLFEAIDANGFRAVSTRFNPSVYYQQNPRVSGNYDGDYAQFQLGGSQDAALRSVVALTKARRIPLLVVNLPVTNDYLDSTRSNRQQQFRQYMQNQARSLGFVWRDYSQGNLSRNDYFEDPNHLNRFGAAAVARQLAGDQALRWPRRQ
jgi:lysophospholipase L1-like esterase